MAARTLLLTGLLDPSCDNSGRLQRDHRQVAPRGSLEDGWRLRRPRGRD